MKRFLGKLFIMAGILAIVGGTTFALPPPRPGLVDPLTGRFRTTGQKVPVFPKEIRTPRPSARKGRIPLDPKRAPSRAGVRPMAVDTSVDNTITPLVLLIDFADRPASSTPSIANPSSLDALFFGSGPSDLSVRNYWNEVSYAKFTIQPPSAVSSNPNVVGWLRAGVDFPSDITLSSEIAGVQPDNVSVLLDNVISYLKTQNFDFSPYTRGADGSFHAVIIVQPGYGAEDSGNPASDTYSHSALIVPVPIATPAGSISDYVIVPAVQYYNDPTPGTEPDDDQRIGAGVIVHEMGHLLELPDLYPTVGGGVVENLFSGAGVYDLMAYGMWGSDLLLRADTPAHLSAWSKSFLGWVSPSLVDATSTRSLRPVEKFGDVDKIYSNTAADPTQYFLVENREKSSPLGSWLFDKFLPGAGALVWQIDEYVITNYPLNVNGNPQFRGVYVKEADGQYHLAQTITGANANDRAIFFGVEADYFKSGSQVFDRTNPSATVNSFPIVDVTYTSHPRDYKRQVSLSGFFTTDNNVIEYVASIPKWKTYNKASTTPPAYPAGMPGDDILSLAFDSGNNTWMGSSDRGIFRFLGTRFDILDSTQGLPEASPPATFPLSPIRAMAFESATGSMWVGTDRGLYKMRDPGNGFRVTDTSHIGGLGLPGNRVDNTLVPAANVIRALAIRGGFADGSRQIDIKYAATPAGLLRVDDLNNDLALDDNVKIILAGNVTSVAVDNNGTPTPLDDIVWVGFADGTFTRSLLPGNGGNPTNDPVGESNFKSPRYSLSGNPGITILSVDEKGRLWIGTDTQGLQVFDLRETSNPPETNLRDPLRFDPAGDGVAEAYLNTTRGLASNHVTGITFQAFRPSPTRTEVVAWISGVPVSPNPPDTEGGVTRFDANAAHDNTIDKRVTVFQPEAGVPPKDQVNGPASKYVSSAAADRAGNVWFGTTRPNEQGVSRFGDAGIPSLDKGSYINTTAIATVTLQNDGLNISPDNVDLADVVITSDKDKKGFTLTLTETGVNTGVFQGTFGFTTGNTDSGAHLIQVENGSKVFVNTKPEGLIPAEASWNIEFPFEDGLIIKPWCFIATAAYGSIMAPEVRVFRTFRDRFLLAVPGGETVVSMYYRFSPPLAGWIAQRPARRFLARCVLVPPSMAVNWAVGTTPGEKALTVLVLLVVFLGFRRRWAGGAGHLSAPGDTIH